MVQVTAPPSTTPQHFVLDAARAHAFAAACGDPVGVFQAPLGSRALGAPAPPMAVAIGTLVQGVQPVLQEVLRAAGPDSLLRVMHREESMAWHQGLRLGIPYTIEPQLLGHEVRRAGAFVHIAVTVRDGGGRPVVSSRSSLYVRPPEGPRVTVPSAAPPSAPAAAGSQLVQRLPSWTVAHDQPERYAAASLEANPIHLRDDIAQAAGLPRRILHGMCTLAYAARALSGHVKANAAAPQVSALRLLQLSARFVRPVYCLDTLTCRILAWEGQSPHLTLRFDVVQQDGIVVLGRGRALF